MPCIWPPGCGGTDDRLGRALACLAFALPVVLIFAVGQCFFTGSWDALPGQLGLSLGILFTGLGLSSVVSARYTVAVPLPGDSPFKKPPGNVGQTLAVQFAGMGILSLLVLPEVGLFIAQLVTGNPVFGWTNLAVGLMLGLALFGAGSQAGRQMAGRPRPGTAGPADCQPLIRSTDQKGGRQWKLSSSQAAGRSEQLAADAVEALLRRKPDAVLGLATGSSPLPVYDELAARHERRAGLQRRARLCPGRIRGAGARAPGVLPGGHQARVHQPGQHPPGERPHP